MKYDYLLICHDIVIASGTVEAGSEEEADAHVNGLMKDKYDNYVIMKGEE